jgi:hypothetical protein
MNELILEALDGSNPLAFLAALGVLNVLSDIEATRAPDRPSLRARLSWRDEGGWRPVVYTELPMTAEALIDLVMTDLKGWENEPALQLKYAKTKEGKVGKEAWDLKPSPERFIEYLRDLVSRAHSSNSRRAVDLAVAFGTDVAVDNGGNTKPTALHFTAGQQEFLVMVDTLRQNLVADDVREALFGPWKYTSELPVLQWDSSVSRDYAFRAVDPSKDKKQGVPGADWLAVRGLPFLRAFPEGSRVKTTGCSGEWKSGKFRWPLWTVPLTRETVHSVVGLPPDEFELSGVQARARGLGAVYESSIRRSDQGGYGSFTPSRVV